MTHKIRGVDVEKYAYYVNKLRRNVGLETWLWRQIVTSQTAHTKYKWPPYANEWSPPGKFSAYATDGSTKGTKKYIFNCIWTSGKRGSQLVCCTILISKLSLNVFVIWELTIQYNPQIFVMVSRFYFLSHSVSNGVIVLFALLALNVIQTVLLQLKRIPWDSA